MKSTNWRVMLEAAVEATQAAGQLLRHNLRRPKKANATMAHDIKLELDVRCQKSIEKRLRTGFPQVALLGEEGVAGDPQAALRWVVDPIDGTVNFAYGIPHACVSIALQEIIANRSAAPVMAESYQTQLGVVYDPFRDELWTAIRGQPARLNGKKIQVSRRHQLAEAVISLGFAKHEDSLKKMLPNFQQLIHRVRKIRIMGSAALDLVYVASGRLDAYLESGLRLWDIAAGGLILECAGGEFWRRPLPGDYFYHVVATNGLMRQRLDRFRIEKTST